MITCLSESVVDLSHNYTCRWFHNLHWAMMLLISILWGGIWKDGSCNNQPIALQNPFISLVEGDYSVMESIKYGKGKTDKR